jgi:hypothetical protein
MTYMIRSEEMAENEDFTATFRIPLSLDTHSHQEFSPNKACGLERRHESTALSSAQN